MSPSTHKWAHLAGPDLLAKWRAKVRKTQQEAANAIGCDLTQYNAFENGRERPGLVYAVTIASVTNGKVLPQHWITADEARAA